MPSLRADNGPAAGKGVLRVVVAGVFAVAATASYLVSSRAPSAQATSVNQPAKVVSAAFEPRLGRQMVRGITVGPIESALHSGQGYGSEHCAVAMQEVRRMGANWVSLTPFGRVWNLSPTGISLTFEQPFPENRIAVSKAVQQAHAAGLKVLIVPHLWVETGDWRGEIEPQGEAGWSVWQKAYREFLMTWADVAEQTGVDMLAVGVELRSWVTTSRGQSFIPLIEEVRERYSGLLTYAGNWDDVEDTVILGELDVIGINAFYPLSRNGGARVEQLLRGGRQVVRQVQKLSERWNKPVIFTEFGYTTRQDPALRPWEWPEHLDNVVVDEQAQAEAYFALLAPFQDEPWFAGFFVWRVFSNPEDVSQESEWGFSPRGKLAELVLRDAFSAHWAADGGRWPGRSWVASRANAVALF